MRYFIFILATILSVNSFAQLSDRERKCIKAKNLASKDMYNRELKYYRYGLMEFDNNSAVEYQILKDQYNIELIQLGCVVTDSVLCYNEMAEKIIERKYGPKFWDRLKQQVDSASNAQQKVIITPGPSVIHRAIGYEPTYVSIMKAEARGVKKAVQDYQNGQLIIHKYYKAINKDEARTLKKILNNQYGFQFEPLTGVVNQETQGYRKQALQFANEKYGDDFWQQLQKQTDSARIEQQPIGDRIE